MVTRARTGFPVSSVPTWPLQIHQATSACQPSGLGLSLGLRAQRTRNGHSQESAGWQLAEWQWGCLTLIDLMEGHVGSQQPMLAFQWHVVPQGRAHPHRWIPSHWTHLLRLTHSLYSQHRPCHLSHSADSHLALLLTPDGVMVLEVACSARPAVA